MSRIWIKSIIAFLLFFPISVFLHEAGHWIIYELNGVESWISLQRANIVNEEQLTEPIFLRSLAGGPAVTLLLAIVALVTLHRYRSSIWIMIFGLINSTFRILPTVIGGLTAFKTDLKGVSDEGNIVLRILENGLIRELVILLLLLVYTLLIIRFYKTFSFPEGFKMKKLLIIIVCLLTVLVSLSYPALDRLLLGV